MSSKNATATWHLQALIRSRSGDWSIPICFTSYGVPNPAQRDDLQDRPAVDFAALNHYGAGNLTIFHGVPERIRTSDPQLRKLVLYPLSYRHLITLPAPYFRLGRMVLGVQAELWGQHEPSKYDTCLRPGPLFYGYGEVLR